jgi:hypothetical protein
MPNQSQTPEPPESGAKVKAFMTGAIIAASALVGGLAVVLWNRKALSGLRQHPEAGKNPSPDASDDES